MNEALRHWVANVHDTFYIIGTVAGPNPYPELVRDFQSVIGDESREQILKAEGRLPDMLIAPVGRSEAPTSELQSLMRSSYAAVCLHTLRAESIGSTHICQTRNNSNHV